MNRIRLIRENQTFRFLSKIVSGVFFAAFGDGFEEPRAVGILR